MWPGQKNNQVGRGMKNAAEEEEASAPRGLAPKKTEESTAAYAGAGASGAGLPSAPRNRERPGHGRAREGGDKGALEAGAPLETVVSGHPGGRRGVPGRRRRSPSASCVQGKGEAISSLGDEGSSSPHPAFRGHRGLGGDRVRAGGEVGEAACAAREVAPRAGASARERDQGDGWRASRRAH